MYEIDVVLLYLLYPCELLFVYCEIIATFNELILYITFKIILVYSIINKKEYIILDYCKTNYLSSTLYYFANMY